MAKIQSKITNDVFEAPAADFANEADFTIVDDATPITTIFIPNVGDTSATAATTPASGTTDVPADTAGAADVGNAAAVTDPSVSATAASVDSSAPVDSGNVVAAPGAAASDVTSSTSSTSAAPADLGNDAPAAVAPDAPATLLGTAADSAAADAATPVDTIQPPVTDSVTSSPTGGPTAGNGATLDAKGKHIVADQLESDSLYAIAQIITVTDSLKHAADAFFDQVRSQIDVEAAS